MGYLSDAVRRAYGIEYTGPAVVHKVKKAKKGKKPKHVHVKKAKKVHVKKGHIVHIRVPTLRGNGHLVHYRSRF